MKRFVCLLSVVLAMVLGAAATARGQDADFAAKVDVTPMESLSIQHNQTLKTLDTFSRQVLTAITGKPRLDGRPALVVILDFSYRPHEYVDRNIVKIKNATLVKDLAESDVLPQDERDRLRKEKTISLATYKRPEMQQFLQRLASSAAFKLEAVNQLHDAAGALDQLSTTNLNHWQLLPPATNVPTDHIWLPFMQLLGGVPGAEEILASMGARAPAVTGVYQQRPEQLKQMMTALTAFSEGWRAQDAAAVNRAAVELATVVPAVNPELYPSAAKRKTEVVYNRLAKLTLPGAALYFVAFVCFLIAARSGVVGLRLWGLRLLVVAFVVHTVGIGIRWWLVEKSVGNWFEAIPIKNQFESVLFSAWFGALVGLILEFRKSRSIFGAAACFVGWLSLTAIFATPYVFNKDIGGEIRQSAGVLMSYWLYIHVTMVTAAYALIGMSFCLGVWWLIRYYAEYGTLSRIPARQLSADAAEREEAAISRRETGGSAAGAGDDYMPVGGSGAGAVSLGFWQTLAALAFFPQARARATQAAVTQQQATTPFEAADRTRSFLATLDLCNLVVLQLSFWILGVGVILGAVWADQSWGRPWGWDPKETFALVTWIVYLVIVHIRIVTAEKAYWTAVLSILGFIVMLFNWIGVNFFLVGLHSYA